MNTIGIKVNGKPVEASVEPRIHLADFLRETQNLTGTHLGCEHGVCGACTLLVDGVPTRSCITLAVACDGAEVTTVEGLDNDDIATELRAEFTKEHGLQCGFCTPGMIVSARDIVLRVENPSEYVIRVLMSGNLCRCTGYVGITHAIQNVIAVRRSRGIAAIPDGNRKDLGPSGSGHAQPLALASPVAKTKALPTSKGAAVASPTVRVPRRETGWKPQTSFTQSFTVAHPVDQVWEFFGKIGAVASCLPGTSLSGEPVDGHVEGQIKIKVGPITAEFGGTAEVTRDEATQTGTIDGSGKDKRSNSSTHGVIGYQVKRGSNPAETQVDLTIGFTLTGALAQFGRSGLVQDIASRLIGLFAQNLEAKLTPETSGEGSVAPFVIKELDAGSMMSSIIKSRIKGLFAKLRRSPSVAAIPDENVQLLAPAPAAKTESIPASKNAAVASPTIRALRRETDWKPQTSFTQSFTVAHPVDQVWNCFGKIGEVASCLPGTSLSGEPVDGHVEGQIKIKVGPIAADFGGTADVTRDEATQTGTIDGSGKDKRSNSATRGLIGYRVKPGSNPDETQVDLTIGFTLTGALAQFSRSGLVQDIASRLIGVFVQNLEAKLTHEASGENSKAPVVVRELDAGSMLSSIIKSRIKGWLRAGRLFKKRN
jgi:carbon-monoxide dehydrogenase small subunit